MGRTLRCAQTDRTASLRAPARARRLRRRHRHRSAPRSPPRACSRRTSARRRSSGRTRSASSSSRCAIGYWYGGRVADRDPTLERPAEDRAARRGPARGGPVRRRPVPRASPSTRSTRSAPARSPARSSRCSCSSPCRCSCSGMVAPYAIRLAVAAASRRPGTIAGRLYAISTIGSLLGTFLSALLLIPLLGTRRTFLVFALALALVAVLGPAPARGCSLVPGAARRCSSRCRSARSRRPRTATASSTRPTPSTSTRASSRTRRRRPLPRAQRGPGGPLDASAPRLVPDRQHLGRVPRRAVRRARRAAAGGSRSSATPPARPRARTATTSRDTYVDGVEIDGELTEIGREYFDMRNPRLETFTDDARPFLRADRPQRYDAILVDAYRQPYIPFYLATKEFFELARDRLNPGGVVLVNVGHPEGSTDLEEVLGATMADVFDDRPARPGRGHEHAAHRHRRRARRREQLRARDPDAARRPAPARARRRPARIEPRLRGRHGLHRRQGAGRVAHRRVDRRGRRATGER